MEAELWHEGQDRQESVAGGLVGNGRVLLGLLEGLKLGSWTLQVMSLQQGKGEQNLIHTIKNEHCLLARAPTIKNEHCPLARAQEMGRYQHWATACDGQVEWKGGSAG